MLKSSASEVTIHCYKSTQRIVKIFSELVAPAPFSLETILRWTGWGLWWPSLCVKCNAIAETHCKSSVLFSPSLPCPPVCCSRSLRFASRSWFRKPVQRLGDAVGGGKWYENRRMSSQVDIQNKEKIIANGRKVGMCALICFETANNFVHKRLSVKVVQPGEHFRPFIVFRLVKPGVWLIFMVTGSKRKREREIRERDKERGLKGKKKEKEREKKEKKRERERERERDR